MSEAKTKKTSASVTDFVKSIEDISKRNDCRVIMRMLRKITGKRPYMWGDSIVGYGEYRYKYKSGREGDWPLIGFSPRKKEISIYIMDGFKTYSSLLKKIGNPKTSVCCLYLKTIEGVDLKALETLFTKSVAKMKKLYPPK